MGAVHVGADRLVVWQPSFYTTLRETFCAQEICSVSFFSLTNRETLHLKGQGGCNGRLAVDESCTLTIKVPNMEYTIKKTRRMHLSMQ